MEIIPPSFTGDPNSARCEESCFQTGFICMNAALAYDRLGFRNLLDFSPMNRADYFLAVAEEVRARRVEAAGGEVKSRKDQIGEYRWKKWARWRKQRMVNKM